jgi:uncharacterized protein (DUF58 family)
MAIGLIRSSWQLIAFAAPLLGVLCSVSWQRLLPTVSVHAEPGSQRCFEAEQTQTTLFAATETYGAAVKLTASVGDGMLLDIIQRTAGQQQTVATSAERWGRYTVRATVEVIAHGGLLVGAGTVDAAEVTVFPITPSQPTTLPPTELLDRLGTHLTRHIGRGVEYADIRAYVPGDQLRTVNWPVSARRGRLHVTQRLTDRSADVVVLIDGYPQPVGPATDATERIVRGAAQVVQTALRNGDRAGIVALGGRRPRWLGADIGQRQFYRVLDIVLDAGDEFESTTGTLAPRAAIPSGAIVVGFSTLLDTEFALALIDLRRRGHVVVAVDVLQGAPFRAAQDPLVDRMWTLQRSAMYRDMGTVGVDVLAWQADRTLDQSMRAVPDHRRPLTGRRS